MSSARLDEKWARSPRMVSRTIGGRCVLVPLAERGADLVDAVVERFEVDRERAEADTLELLETLQEIRAVVPASPGGR